MKKLSDEYFEIVENTIREHHKLYRYPVKGEYVEDLLSLALEHVGYDHEWVEGGHASGADIICENDQESFSVKSNTLRGVDKMRMDISSYRLTRFGNDINKMTEYIDNKNFGSYLIFTRRSQRGKAYEKLKEKGGGFEEYFLFQIPSDIVTASDKEWEKTGSGWKAKIERGFHLSITKSMSNQYWINGIPYERVKPYCRRQFKIYHKNMQIIKSNESFTTSNWS